MGPSEHPEQRTIYIKNEFFEMIRSGAKTLELRVAFPDFKRVRVGEEIIFSTESKTVGVKICDIRNYSNLADVFRTENISKLAPGKTWGDIQMIARQILKEKSIDQYGLLVFEFSKI